MTALEFGVDHAKLQVLLAQIASGDAELDMSLTSADELDSFDPTDGYPGETDPLDNLLADLKHAGVVQMPATFPDAFVGATIDGEGERTIYLSLGVGPLLYGDAERLHFWGADDATTPAETVTATVDALVAAANIIVADAVRLAAAITAAAA